MATQLKDRNQQDNICILFELVVFFISTLFLNLTLSLFLTFSKKIRAGVNHKEKRNGEVNFT